MSVFAAHLYLQMFLRYIDKTVFCHFIMWLCGTGLPCQVVKKRPDSLTVLYIVLNNYEVLSLLALAPPKETKILFQRQLQDGSIITNGV